MASVQVQEGARRKGHNEEKGEYFSGQPASFQWLGSRSWRCGPGGAPALAGAVGHCAHLLIFVSDDTLLVSAMSFGLAAMDTGESMVLAP